MRQQQNAITRKKIGKLQLRSIHPWEEKKRDVNPTCESTHTSLTIATTDCRDAASERVWIVSEWVGGNDNWQRVARTGGINEMTDQMS